MIEFKRFFLQIDDKLNIVSCNDEFLEFIGKEHRGNLRDLIYSQDFDALESALSETPPGENGLACFRIKTASSELSWIATSINIPRNSEDTIKLDMSDIQALKTEVSADLIDKMTGLFNKAAVTEYAKQLMSQRPYKHFYFFLMDVDNFKSVNDTFGHMTGDEVIVSVAETARKYVGEKGVVGRIGGDEFMLVLEKVSTEPELRDILRNIRYTIREKYQDESQNKTVTLSMGGGLFPDDADSYDKMFMLADKMLYRAKTKGRDRYIIYTSEIHGNVLSEDGVSTGTKEMVRNSERTDLIMELMDSLLVKKTISLNDAAIKILKTFNLDGFYILKRGEYISHFGITVSDSKDGWVYNSGTLDMSSVIPEDYTPAFDTYPIKVVNMYDLQKEHYPMIASFMAHNNLRVLVVYHMTQVPDGGYLIYASNATSSCRLAETDFADLTYFSRMLELGGYC